MYVSLTRVSTADQPIENAAIVAQEMMRWFRETEGFEGLLFLSKEGRPSGSRSGRVVTSLSVTAFPECSSAIA